MLAILPHTSCKAPLWRPKKWGGHGLTKCMVSDGLDGGMQWSVFTSHSTKSWTMYCEYSRSWHDLVLTWLSEGSSLEVLMMGVLYCEMKLGYLRLSGNQENVQPRRPCSSYTGSRILESGGSSLTHTHTHTHTFFLPLSVSFLVSHTVYAMI